MDFRRFIAIPVLTSFLFLGVFGFSGITRASDEVIDSFDANITIGKDGLVQVEETIVYDFGSSARHGIFRDIPLTAKDGPTLLIDVQSVVDGSGQAYTYTASTTRSQLQIKIGDPDVLVSGVKTYVIDYTVTNAIRPFDDHDELYWNVTGNEWPVSINKASAVIYYPAIMDGEVNATCYTGPSGTTGKDCEQVIADSATSKTTATKVLGAGEGLTVVLGIPLGVVDDTVIAVESAGDGFQTGMFNVLFFSIAGVMIVVTFALALGSAMQFIKSNRYKGPRVVQYHPPAGLLPIDVGTIVDKSVDSKDISSMILDLAIRGYIKIRYTVKEIRFWPDKKDFEFDKLKDGSDLTHPAEKILFAILFTGRDTVALSALTNLATKYEAQFKAIATETDDYLHERGYFDKEAKVKASKLTKQIVAGSVVVMILVGLLSTFTEGASFFIAFPAALLIAYRVSLANRMAHLFTDKGMKAEAEIYGFKDFLTLTDKDKIDLLNAPALEPTMFEKFLPFAMVLGVETKWAEKFAGMYLSAPSWYEDRSGAAFSNTLFIQNMMFLNSSFNNTVASSSPHSSSGFSGGSSGGGSGGGGGGSW